MLLSLQLALGLDKPPTIANESSSKQVSLDDKINSLAKEYNVNAALAKRIMGCESGGGATRPPKADAIRLNRRKDGSVWSRDIGYGQINSYYWQKDLLKEGFDINVPDQNLEATFYLMQKYGTGLWHWSEHCWG